MFYSLYAPAGVTTFSATVTFSNKNLDEFVTGGATGVIATFTLNDNPDVTVVFRIVGPEEVIVGDPHFFVGRSLYDWKQVRARAPVCVCVCINKTTTDKQMMMLVIVLIHA